MRRHSPVSLVADEKRGSTITQQAVNELIKSLESAGELSIREQKFLKLAKAYQQLAAENAHLASRKQRLIEIIQNVNNDYCMCGDLMKRHVNGGCGYPTGMFDYHYNKWLEEEDATPATDRIVAGIKADAITASLDACSDYLETDCVMDRLDISYEEAEKRTSGAMEFHDSIVAIAQQLREGAK
ncbi:hNH endonuclease [Klebsiella michiganensis]|uniref:hNH endonuclease n=1 Tax=Klebsiella michiganensis TaxID=1134687 RepID=UPI003BF7DA2A